jgi:hypothetical protein
MSEKNPRFGLIALSLLFVAAGLLFARRLGIETDEAMLANGIYDHGAPLYSWRIGGFEIPVMLITYLGALKTWLYNPYFAIWTPSAVSLRLPAILAGAGTLWLFFIFVDRVAGRLAAWIGTCLLATDSVFLLIEATDFGFVALQFVLKLAAILLLLRFHRSGSPRALAGGFFLLGLAMWDKSVFAWVLFGLIVAAVAVFPREVWKHMTRRNTKIAAVAMLVGALPLVVYNIAHPLITLRANAKAASIPVLAKADLLARTLNGSVLFGFMSADNPGPNPARPRRTLQTLSERLAGWRGGWHRNLLLPALALAILIALPARRARKPVLFGLIVCAATWLAMAFTADAGAAQHTILLWPFPLFIVAVALAQLPRRVAIALAAVLCLANIAVTNQYYAELMRNGPGIRFTDAINPLKDYLRASNAPRIFSADWGFIETLCLLTEGELPVFNADVRDPDMAHRIVSGPGHLFVSHTPGFTFMPAIRARLDDWARKDGYEEEPVTTIADRNGRPTFEVFRFRKRNSN